MTDSPTPTPESTRHGLPSALIHDLRTPLNLIIGYSEMLIEQAQDAGKQLLALIQNSFHPNGAWQRPADFVAPLEENTTPPEQGHFEEPFSEYATPAEPVSGTAQGLLLVVDDIEANRDVLSRRLQRQGYVVATAENGRQALEMMQANTFDLVLLDVMMPEMDGYEVLYRLKVDEALHHIPVNHDFGSE